MDLVSSVGAVGGIVIFLFTITTRYYQPDIAFAVAMLAAACLGFILNWPPAKIFLGFKSGSYTALSVFYQLFPVVKSPLPY